MGKLYENIKVICELKGTNISRMETATKIPKNSLANWNDDPHWTEYLQRVAAYLEVPIDTLFHFQKLDTVSPFDRVKAALVNMPIDDISADAIIGIAKIITDKYSKID